MACFSYGKSVRGATHIRNGTVCQDSYKIDETIPDVHILAVADGHGSEKSPRSKNGSTIAVNVFCSVMAQYVKKYAEESEELLTYLNRDGGIKFAQEICEEWQKRVKDSYYEATKDDKSVRPLNEDGSINWRDVYRLYGTTLVGLLITKSYIFGFQIGDGDIILVNKESISPVVETEKILGTETHSLSKPDAWKKAVSVVRRRDVDADVPYLYMISSDGFVNSFISEEEHQKSCRDYYDLIAEHGFDTVCKNLEKWLSETSELGCGDDITLILAYVV